MRWQEPLVAGVHFPAFPLTLFPQNVTGMGGPELSAKGVLVLDPVSQVRLFEKNSQDRFLPASTVKMMTALVAIESFRPGEILTVPKIEDEGQDIKLKEGEELTIESLLFALLVASANDAAETLAFTYPGGRPAFVQKMNELASRFFLKETHFTNPAGIDEENQYTSPFDLALLAKNLMRQPFLSRLVATKKMMIASTDGTRQHEMENINQLLGKVEGVKGVKTGWTEEAGECLVTYVEREGKKLIIVVLGSEDRFGETEKLINWAFENFAWRMPEPAI